MLFGLAMLLSFVFAFTGTTYAQFDKPDVPYLSITGQDAGYDKDWYPDGRIWLPASSNGPREFLLPVWIENRWVTYPQNAQRFQADPIYSFEFTLLYDSTAIRAVGVQKFGPRDADLGYEPLAKSFNISWDDNRDTNRYKVYLNNNVAWQDKQKGRAMVITGSSTTDPLPHTDLNSREWKVLMYIRFRVIPEVNKPLGAAGNTPIIIDNHVIRYNDWNIRTDNPFEKLRKLNVPGVEQYDPREFTGLGGINNSDKSIYNIEPSKEGVIYLRITDRIPQFDFSSDRGIGSIPALVKPNNLDYEWEMVDPITIDSASVDPLWGKRLIKVMNGISLTRLLDVEVESDQPWLKVQARRLGANDKIPPSLSSSTRYGTINWMDNGILGDNRDPFDNPTTLDGNVQLEVQCDPNELSQGQGEEKAGIYVGYLTFKSSTALYSPVRMKITFIYFRNPVEWFNQSRNPGIELTVRNSNGPVGDYCNLIFGTGYRATDGVDKLFGEFAYESPLSGFGARFYPRDPNLLALIPYGFGDWAPNDETPRSSYVDANGVRHGGSRDIRSTLDTTNSILYWVKFDAGGAANYPVTVEWDTTDFPEGSQLFLRDAVNGSYFNVNMRSATPLPTPNKFGYIFGDPKWTEFIIEYTLPKVIRYVDAEGNPIIKPGWNFLSLPVRPTNNYWKSFYPNAVNEPIKFGSVYQPEQFLKPGIGYFVRYPNDIVDTTFAGSFISHLTKNQGDTIRLYTGWNTIGALTVPTNTKDLNLDPFDINNPPIISETFKMGIYGYKTNQGYKEVSELDPGLGYWLYTDKGAYLNEVCIGCKTIANDNNFANEKETIKSNSTELTLIDNSKNVGTVYISGDKNVDLTSFSLPPAPPYELFDIRFSNGTYVTNSNTSIITLQGTSYPISITMNRADANYTFIDAVTKENLGTISKGSNSSLTIRHAKSNAIEVVREASSFSLSVYPNPVDGISTVKFALPESEHAVVKLYDAMGNEVATLFDGNAGSLNDVQLNSSNLSNGTYIIKLTAGSQILNSTVTIVK